MAASTHTSSRQKSRIIAVALALSVSTVGLLMTTAGSARAAVSVPLGTAADYAVLAGSAVTNTGTTVITGNVGTSPGAAIGQVGIVLTGSYHAADAPAGQAESDLTTGYNTAAGLTPTEDLTGQDLGGLTKVEGVYSFSSSAQLTGNLTLDGGGKTDGVWVFQIGSTLTTASDSSVTFIKGANPCNVYWQVSSSATLGTSTHFAGNVLALTSITANTGATVSGRLLALNGAVTLQSNTISQASCVTAPPTTASPTSGTSTSGTPTSGTPTSVTPSGVDESDSGLPTESGTDTPTSSDSVSTSPSGVDATDSGNVTSTETTTTTPTTDAEAAARAAAQLIADQLAASSSAAAAAAAAASAAQLAAEQASAASIAAASQAAAASTTRQVVVVPVGSPDTGDGSSVGRPGDLLASLLAR